MSKTPTDGIHVSFLSFSYITETNLSARTTERMGDMFPNTALPRLGTRRKEKEQPARLAPLQFTTNRDRDGDFRGCIYMDTVRLANVLLSPRVLKRRRFWTSTQLEGILGNRRTVLAYCCDAKGFSIALFLPPLLILIRNCVIKQLTHSGKTGKKLSYLTYTDEAKYNFHFRTRYSPTPLPRILHISISVEVCSQKSEDVGTMHHPQISQSYEGTRTHKYTRHGGRDGARSLFAHPCLQTG